MATHQGTHLSRFWEGVDKSAPNDCWLWTRGISRYGTTRNEDGPISAHRYSYQLAYGAIPDGLEIDHICAVKRCVNPSHLRAVTHRENSRGARLAGASKLSCAHGHLFTEENTYMQGNVKRCKLCSRNRKRQARLLRSVDA